MIATRDSNSIKSWVPLGNTREEHERLARQAAHLVPITERMFRGAGIAPGQRVLDLGSGAGDVSMLVANIVGPSGEVVGVERNPESVAWARARVEKASLRNVSFTQADVGEIPAGKPFDAAVGRFILMFVPDPVVVVRSAARLVKPGGVIVFLEPSYKALFQLSEHLPLWFQAITITMRHYCARERTRRWGSNSTRFSKQPDYRPPAWRWTRYWGVRRT